MKVLELTPNLCPELVTKITKFEALFDYPLGDSQRFRIEHGPDFTAFFCAIGEANTWTIQSGRNIVAALSSALRTVQINGQDYRIAYMGDLKVHPRYQVLGSNQTNVHRAETRPRTIKQKKSSGSGVAQYLRRLINQEADCAYCVVMDGTKITPDDYTGGERFPKLKPVANLYILRFETKAAAEKTSTMNVSATQGFALYKQLCGTALCDLSNFKLRSTISPRWFTSGDKACGMLEDTRRAKRLYLETGEELLSAHLSYFAFDDINAARAVLEASLNSALLQKFPAMFVALSEAQHLFLAPFLKEFRYSTSPATVYATDKKCALIPINTSEI